MMIRSQAVLDSARGAPCSVRFPGICNGNAETTVWCHLNGHAFGKGAGIKAHDIAGFAGCSSCHEYYDRGHGTKPLLSTDTLLECVLSAVLESYVRLIVSGVVTVPQDTPKPAHERPIPARKPKAERAKVPNNPDRKIPSRPMRTKETAR
ncbi:MAG: nuclease domain-containing protein [Cypionkella sp.]